ncbi:MAG TPA: hypothetical protein DEB31_06885 [Clostridiales bacterium]|nr:hypothetical protein [Clostridiales bacterium]
MNDPKVYLAIDNCFAYKRWTRPMEWMALIRDLGVCYVEASADTELDPLYMGGDYLAKWVRDVEAATAKTGVSVANVFSGHGTYTTLGLAHTDAGVRERFKTQWFYPMVDIAAQLQAGFGFLVHGFAEFILQDKMKYGRKMEELYAILAEINTYAKQKGCERMMMEQMYSPQMPPWTIDGMVALMREVARRSGSPFFFVEDTGHHHHKFLRPEIEAIKKAFAAKQAKGLWLGTERTFEIYNNALASGRFTDGDVDAIRRQIEDNPHMFTEERDNDCYTWMKAVGCYAAIVHLQQTDGASSKHLPFTEENNENGIIEGGRVLRALKHSYDNAEPDGLEQCDKVFLTLELFFGATETSNDMLYDYRKSVEYWRRFVPEDGLPLSALVGRLA